MANFSKLQNHTNTKTVQFSWANLMNETEIVLDIPEFSNNKYAVSGDWGPKYIIDVNPMRPLHISYRDLNTNQLDEYSLEQRNFELSSPMLYQTRKKFPFILSLADERKGIKFQLYLDENSKTQKVEVLRSADEVVLFEKQLA